jgi:hypothetical protein
MKQEANYMRIIKNNIPIFQLKIIITIILSTLLLLSGCSNKGQNIYENLHAKIAANDYFDAWPLVDSLKRINPAFHNGDMTISLLIQILDSCCYQHLNTEYTDAQKISEIETIFNNLKILKQNNPGSKYLSNGLLFDCTYKIDEIKQEYSRTHYDPETHNEYDPYLDTVKLFTRIAEDSLKIRCLCKMVRFVKNEDTTIIDSCVSDFNQITLKEVDNEKKNNRLLVMNQTPYLNRSQLIGNWNERYKDSNGSRTDNRYFYPDGTFKGNQIEYFTWTDEPARISWAGKWEIDKNIIKLSDVYVKGEYRSEYDKSRYVAVSQNNRWMLFEFGSDMSPNYDPERRMAGLRTDDPQIVEAIKKGNFWRK